MTTANLRAEDLVFAIRDIVTVGPVSLDVPSGGSVGVVGETGSGKSLLCRTIVGMLDNVGGTITSGSLRYGDQDFTRADRGKWATLRRHHVGYMPQASMSSLNPVRRIGSQLAELLEGSRADKHARSVELMQQVQMREPEAVLRRYPHELSGGMRQRVMLAFSIAGDPQILVADEPTTALDATVQSEILGLVQRIQAERGMSLVLVSHDMRVIRRMCESIVVMYRGRVVESGLTAAVLESPKHPYTRALLAADPSLAPRKTLLGAIDEEMRASFDEDSVLAASVASPEPRIEEVDRA